MNWPPLLLAVQLLSSPDFSPYLFVEVLRQFLLEAPGQKAEGNSEGVRRWRIYSPWFHHEKLR